MTIFVALTCGKVLKQYRIIDPPNPPTPEPVMVTTGWYTMEDGTKERISVPIKTTPSVIEYRYITPTDKGDWHPSILATNWEVLLGIIGRQGPKTFHTADEAMVWLHGK